MNHNEELSKDLLDKTPSLNIDKKLAFKKVPNSNAGFLILKKEDNNCTYKVVFVRHG